MQGKVEYLNLHVLDLKNLKIAWISSTCHWNFGPENFGPWTNFFTENFDPPDHFFENFGLALKILVPNILVSQTDCFGPPECLVALNLHYPIASTCMTKHCT